MGHSDALFPLANNFLPTLMERTPIRLPERTRDFILTSSTFAALDLMLDMLLEVVETKWQCN